MFRHNYANFYPCYTRINPYITVKTIKLKTDEGAIVHFPTYLKELSKIIDDVLKEQGEDFEIPLPFNLRTMCVFNEFVNILPEVAFEEDGEKTKIYNINKNTVFVTKYFKNIAIKKLKHLDLDDIVSLYHLASLLEIEPLTIFFLKIIAKIIRDSIALKYPKYTKVTKKDFNDFLVFIEDNFQKLVIDKLKRERMGIAQEDLKLFKTLLYLEFLAQEFYSIKEYIVTNDEKDYIKNTTLNFQNDSLTSLDGIEIIKNKENIQNINLEANYILDPTIDFKDRKSPFKDFTSLKKLDLSQNFLVNITDDFFLNLKSLETLSLKNNPITKIAENAFKELENLKHLDLSRCNLQKLPKRLLYNLKNLEIIDLSFNEIKKLSSKTFLPLQNIKKIIINNNPFLGSSMDQKQFRKIYKLSSQVQIKL